MQFLYVHQRARVPSKSYNLGYLGGPVLALGEDCGSRMEETLDPKDRSPDSDKSYAGLRTRGKWVPLKGARAVPDQIFGGLRLGCWDKRCCELSAEVGP